MHEPVLKSSLKDDNGQVLSEYVIMLAMCLTVTVSLMALFYYFTEYGWRLLNLVSIDYP
ncbi:hypothetical protein P0136_03545 [Lentisphaerota bacterium ZTH]|nr:hypothetical protein JYG24_05330 [Lentisphaerota bacterium]WET07074.1 hypothetical protein P0136_03545 [Lentisphaerota bacterium ZTH]